jgi:hypothetical protein
MSIRRGSQRRLERRSAVIAGATVTDSTVSLISRRQAANRFAGSHSLSISSGPPGAADLTLSGAALPVAEQSTRHSGGRSGVEQ